MQQEQQTQLNQTSLKVSYEEFNSENVTNMGILTKDIKDTGAKYKELKIGYKYSASNGAYRIEKLDVEYPEIICPKGISHKVQKDGRITYSVGLKMDPITHIKLVEQVEKIYKSTAKQIGENKKDLGLRHFNAEQPQMSQYDSPLYYQRDSDDNIIPGRNVWQYVKLTTYGDDKSKFFGLDESEIDWKWLENAELTIKPLVRFSHIYYGAGRMILQVRLKSAVVIKAVPANSQNSQRDTIKKYKEQNPEAVNLLKEQLRILQEKYNKLANNEQENTSNEQGAPGKREFPTVPETKATQSNTGQIQSITPQVDLQSVLNNQPKSQSPQHSPTQTSQETTNPVVVPKPTLPSVTTSQAALPIPASSQPVQLPISTQSVPLPSTNNTTEQVSTIPLPSL